MVSLFLKQCESNVLMYWFKRQCTLIMAFCKLCSIVGLIVDIAQSYSWIHTQVSFTNAFSSATKQSRVCMVTLRWRHNDHAGVSNHQPHGCLLNRLFRLKSKITSKLRVTGLCAGNSPGTGEFPAQMASYAENVSIWWRHHEICSCGEKHERKTRHREHDFSF